MRRSICLLVALCLCVFLSGCFDYSEIEDKHIVSAVGFSGNEKGRILTLEISGFNDKKCLFAEGESFEQAYNTLKKSLTARLDFSHTACVVFKDEEDFDVIKKAMSFSEGLSYFNSSAAVVFSNDPKMLLVSPSENKGVGYDILKILKQNGVKAHKLYQGIPLNGEDLPIFNATENGVKMEAIKVNA